MQRVFAVDVKVEFAHVATYLRIDGSQLAVVRTEGGMRKRGKDACNMWGGRWNMAVSRNLSGANFSTFVLSRFHARFKPSTNNKLTRTYTNDKTNNNLTRKRVRVLHVSSGR